MDPQTLLAAHLSRKDEARFDAADEMAYYARHDRAGLDVVTAPVSRTMARCSAAMAHGLTTLRGAIPKRASSG